MLIEVHREAGGDHLLRPVPQGAKARCVAGMKLAIDDFGAGYSGLSLLTRFQPDKIKVDAELVRNIHISGTKQAIVASVVRCCEDLGITVGGRR